MKRTEYFNLTKPGQDQLNNTEDSRINTLLERFRATAQFGIRSGFRVTVNGADNTRIDIGVGEGYTGGFYAASDLRGTNSGERISTITTTATGQALADYTNGVDNYISLVYAETSSLPLPERYFPFTAHNTKFEESYTVSALTVTQWNLLTAEQKQQRVLVAIVRAKGAGVALTSADITQLTQPMTHPTCSSPTNITGVSTKGVSGSTPQGTATLTFTTPNSFRFTAPNDTIGTALLVTSSGEWTVYSGNTEYYIVLDVVYANLPGASTSDSLTVASLYGRAIPIAGAQDIAHRDMVGTGAVSTTNVHGISLSDISGGALTHADLFHLNGISYGAESTQLSGALAPGDIVQIVNLGGETNSFLIDGIEYQTINNVTAGDPGEAEFTVADASGDYLVYLDSAARPQKAMLASYAGGAGVPVLWTANLMIWDMHNADAGGATITWTVASRTLQYTAPGDAIGTAVYVNALTPGGTDYYGFYKLYSNNGTDWVLVFANGTLGAIDAATTFTSAKSEAANADESILKICVVTWNNVVPETLVALSLRDIRKFITADDREQLLEEHDDDGLHTKELRNTLRIGTEDSAIMAVAESNSAITGVARLGSVGVYGLAANTAMLASANSNLAAGSVTGLFGLASNPGAEAQATGILGSAVSGTGVFGSGGLVGVYGSCVTAFAGSGVGAGVNTAYGVNVNAANAANPNMAVGVRGAVAGAAATALLGAANAGTGVYGSAGVNVGIFGYAGGATGVYGQAAGGATGVCGSALNNYGVYGYAANVVGVGGSALAATGVYGICAAGNTGVLGYAQNYGVYGTALTSYGVYGTAATLGVYGIAAANTGAMGYAVGSTGVFGIASVNNGGVFSVSNGVAGYNASITGLYGYARAEAPAVGSKVIGGKFYANNVNLAGDAVGIYCDMGPVATGAWATAHTALGGLGSVAGALDAVGLYVDAANPTNVDRAIGIRAGVVGAGATGIYAYHNASGRAIYGSAPAAGGIGVYGAAANIGVFGYAAVSTGVYGQAAGGNGGVVGSARDNQGVYGTANGYGACGIAGDAYGVYGSAVNNYGVYGTASNYGGCFVANAAAATGVYGYAPGANAIGVYGSAPAAGGSGGYFEGLTGVRCSAANAAGVACYGVAGSIGVYASGATFDAAFAHGSGAAAISFGQYVAVSGTAANGLIRIYVEGYGIAHLKLYNV